MQNNDQLRESVWRQVSDKAEEKRARYRVVVGMATCGISAGAIRVYEALRAAIAEQGLQDVELVKTGCIGMCIYEPIVEVYEEGKAKVSYIHVDLSKAQQIVTEHLAHGEVVQSLSVAGLEDAIRVQAEEEEKERLRHAYVHSQRIPNPILSVADIDSAQSSAAGTGSVQDPSTGAVDLRDEQADTVYVPKAPSSSINDLPFYRKQKRVVLANCGVINPEDIREYVLAGGYLALAKAVNEMSPEDVIQQISDSGLRGRGGAGFPTGKKWAFAAKNKAEQKYFICNADEGDPGAFMDRSVLEGDPHAVLEAMALGGYAIGANKGFIYVRAEYPVAVKRLTIALEQARAAHFLGDHILGSDFSFDVDIRLGAGAFVCGEETALISSIEGHRGMPRNKPPFPAEKGLWGCPTVINNVETLANIPAIMRNGAEWFRSFGTEASPGTKVFALGGKINHTGLVEVPMGITLREIIEEIGGSCPNGRKFKAVQTGGPSGGCITVENFDTPIDFDNLTRIGSMMGSGGMIVMDEDNCMVDIARFYLDFTVDESCGQCVPCREGTKRMLEILNRITIGHGKPEDLDKLEQLGKNLQLTSLCALGQTAPNPILSTLRHFRSEYEAHIHDLHCPARVCKGLLGYEITDACRGCTKCVRFCPVGAITGSPRNLHVIDLDLCIRCGACLEGCVFDAIAVR